MQTFGFSSTPKLLTDFVGHYAHKGELDSAHAIQRDMEAQGLKNELVYEILVREWAKRGAMEKLESLIKEMETKNIELTESTWNWLISAYAASKRLEEAMKMLQCAVQKAISIREPCIYTLILSLCRARQFDAALKLFNQLSALGVPSSTRIYQPLISAALVAHQLPTAFSLLANLRHQGLPLKASLCLSILRALARHSVRQGGDHVKLWIFSPGMTLTSINKDPTKANDGTTKAKDGITKAKQNISKRKREAPKQAVASPTGLQEMWQLYQYLDQRGWLSGAAVEAAIECCLAHRQFEQAYQLYQSAQTRAFPLGKRCYAMLLSAFVDAAHWQGSFPYQIGPDQVSEAIHGPDDVLPSPNWYRVALRVADTAFWQGVWETPLHNMYVLNCMQTPTLAAVALFMASLQRLPPLSSSSSSSSSSAQDPYQYFCIRLPIQVDQRAQMERILAALCKTFSPPFPNSMLQVRRKSVTKYGKDHFYQYYTRIPISCIRQWLGQ
eukprot:TRINITY_DN4392_c0_g1_i4.p1 TRINITY_DN4392_c0_g1~~TRINITY_DN4392_c0_g1_i4.p1  ORF type:complete len:498 (+),score=64.61 TRINITY_DN4392_c0_g1_i4:202-1695(+)